MHVPFSASLSENLRIIGLKFSDGTLRTELDSIVNT